MALELARAYVQVVPSMQGVQSSIAQSFGSAGDAAGKTVGTKARSGILSGAIAAGAGFLGAFGVAKVAGQLSSGLGSVLGKGLERATNIQNAQKKLEGLGHSAGSITKIMGSALASVKGTSFGLGDAATVAASAVAAGIKPGKELTAYLKTTADTATIAGGSLSDIGAILNKANTGTAVYSDTLNQLSDRGIPVFTLLAKHYGVNAADFQTMVKKGQVSGAVLSSVLHDKIGGAALDSGKTAEGAYANVGAAFGRLGVQLGSGTAVDRAPALFTAIATAVDNGAAAIKPLSDILNHQLALGFKALTGYINGIDFTAVGVKAKALAGNIKAFLGGLQAPTKIVDGQGILQDAAPLSGLAGLGQRIHVAFAGIVAVFGQVKAALSGLFAGKGLSDGASLGKTLGDIRAVATPLFPALVEVGKSAGTLAGSFAKLITAGVPLLPPILNLLAGAVGFVADHMKDIVPFLPLIAAGFIGWRIATQATLAANRLLTAAQLAALPVTTLNNTTRLLAARAELQVASANGLSTGSIVRNTVATARNGVVSAATAVKAGAVALAQKGIAAAQAIGTLAVGNNTRAVVANGLASARQATASVIAKGVAIAGATATGVATAAQWLFNAALSANPIGLVIAGIVLLVGGLVLFFTKTQLGQQIWANFTRFLSEAFANTVAFLQTAVGNVIGFFTKFGPTILLAVAPIIGIPLLIIQHWGQIVSFFQGLGSRIVGILGAAGKWLVETGGKLLSGLLSGAIAGLSALGRWEAQILAGVLGALTGAGKWLLDTGGKILHGLLDGAIRGLTALGRWEASIFSAVVGALVGAGKWLLTTGPKVIDGLLKGALNGLVALGRWEKSILDAVVGALSGAGRWLLETGGDIIDGLVKGIRNSIGNAISAVKALVNLLPEGVRRLLGIASPSKVFAEIGKFVGQGLVKGLGGTQDQVKTAATSLVSQVTDAFSKLSSQREAAQKRLLVLDRQLTASNRAVASAQSRVASAKTAPAKANARRALGNAVDRRTAIRSDITDQRSIIAGIDAAPKGKARAGILASLKSDSSLLTSLAGTRDRLADALKTAQDKLADAVKVRDDFRDGVQQTSIALGNVVSAFSKVAEIRKAASDSISDLSTKLSDAAKAQSDAQATADDTASSVSRVDTELAGLAGSAAVAGDRIAALQTQRVNLAGNLTEQLTKVAELATKTSTAQADLATAQADAQRASTPTILQTLQQAVADTNTFRATLAQLRNQGIDDTTYSQLVSAGVANGGLQAATELAGAGAGVVQQVAGLQSQLATAGAALGTQTSTVLYQAGVDIAQGSVDGIQAKIVDNQAAIGLLQAALASSVRQLGINTKPLTKSVGADVAAGFADGITGSQSDLDKVVDKLGKAVVRRLRKSLDSHSPSREAISIGQDFGEGYIIGIAAMHRDAERAAEGLAAIPAAAIADFGTSDLGAAPAPIVQNFNGPMGYTKDEIATGIATKGRRAIAGVNIPRVSVR